MGFAKFGDKRVNDLDLLSGHVVRVACLHRENPCRRICMQLAPRTSVRSSFHSINPVIQSVGAKLELVPWDETAGKVRHLRCAAFSY